MNPSDPGGNYPGNRPFDAAPGRPLDPVQSGPQSRPANVPPGYAYPQGAPQPYGQQPMQPPYPYMQPKPFSTKAIIAMVMGGVSVLMWPVAVVTGPIGAILGFLGMKESKEPGATHRGWGLALAGLITSGLMFLVALAMGALFIFVFAKIEEEQQQRSQRGESTAKTEARADMELIRERMQLYAVENGNSLEAGGPVVRDGWASSYGNDAIKVKGRLQLKDLVHESELERPIWEYSLEVTGRHSATLRNSTTGTTMTITDIVRDRYTIN
jgi:hypothetical protein